MLPPTSPAHFRADAVILAGELSEAADLLNWPRIPELRKFEARADNIIPAGYYGAGDLVGTSDADRAQLFKISYEGKAGWSRLLRKMPDAEAPPTNAEVKKSAPFKRD